jgi:hypothetical protein
MVRNISTEKPIIGTKKQFNEYLYMNKDLGKLILERLEPTNKPNATDKLLSVKQLNIVLGERKDEQRRRKG